MSPVFKYDYQVMCDEIQALTLMQTLVQISSRRGCDSLDSGGNLFRCEVFPLEFLSLFIQDPCNHCPDSIFYFYSFSLILHLTLSREVWQLISTFMFEKNIITIEYYEYVKGDETAKRSRKSRFWKKNCFQCQKNVTLFKQTDEKTAIQAEILLYRLVFFYKWVPLPTCIVLVLNLCFQFVCLKSERPKTFSGTLVSPHGFCLGTYFLDLYTGIKGLNLVQWGSKASWKLNVAYVINAMYTDETLGTSLKCYFARACSQQIT